MINEDLVTRIQNYCMKEENRSLAGHVTGYKPDKQEVEFTYGDKKVYVNIDDLEKGYFDEATLTVKKPDEAALNQNVSTAEPSINTTSTTNDNNITNTQETNETNIMNQSTNITLNDIKTLVELKNKDTLDNILKQIAVTNTGDVDINKVMGIVSNNLINETINSMKENRVLSTELYKYDKDGKLISKEEASNVPVDLVTNENNAFNNLMIYIETAKLYGLNYTPEQIQEAKQNFMNAVNSNLNVTPINNTPQKEDLPKTKTLQPIPVDTEKAGFADVFILAVIVLVYAAIIVNLIMKLK